MSEFTASNGVKITMSVGIDALREFFRHEQDEQLGRFRDPSTPGYVAYDRGEGYVRVVREADGTSEVYIRSDVDHPAGLKPAIVAKAFFDAHPEPKPWHDAKPGDVWVLTLNDVESAFYPSKSLDRTFTPVAPGTGRTGVAMDSPEITAGRRIYPAASS